MRKPVFWTVLLISLILLLSFFGTPHLPAVYATPSPTDGGIG